MNRIICLVNRFKPALNRIIYLLGKLNRLNYHLTRFIPYHTFLCLLWFESIQTLNKSIQTIHFVWILSLPFPYYIYSSSYNSQFIESFTSILSRSQKLIAHTFFKIKHFFLESLCLWVYRFSRVLVGIVVWFFQKDLLGLIKASKELNNLIPPPKGLGVFLTVLEIEGGSFTERSIEDSSEEIERVHG